MKVLLNIGLQIYRSADARSAIGYLIANLFAALVPFLLLPILTRALSPASFGQYSLFLLAVSVSMPLVTLMLATVITREYTLREGAAFSRFLSSCITLTVLAVLGVIAVSLLFREKLEALSHLAFPFLLMAFLYALAQGVLTIVQGISTMQKKPRVYILWRAGFAFAGGIAAYLAVMVYQGDWPLLVESQAWVAGTLLLLALIVMIRNRWLTFAFDASDAKLALHYSIPLVIHALTAGVILQTADRFFVAHYMGLAEVGSYNVAQQIALAMYVVVTSMNLAWQPWYYEQMKQNDDTSRRRIVRVTYFGFAGIAVIGLIATVTLWVIFPWLIGAEFQSARAIFPWLILGFVFNGMYVLVAAGMFYTGHTLQLMLCNIVTAAVNIALNMWLVPVYGMVGAASATVLSTMFMLLLVWIMTVRVHRLPWLLREVAPL